MCAQQINAIYSKAIKIPSQERIEFFSKHFDKLYANHERLREFYGETRRTGKRPDHTEDIAHLAALFNDKLGKTWAEIQEPKVKSDLLGAKVKYENMGHVRMWKAVDKLPAWIERVIKKGYLFKNKKGMNRDVPALLDGSDSDSDSDSDEVIDVIEGELEDPSEGLQAGLEANEEAARKSCHVTALKYIKSCKKLPGETAEEFAERMEELVLDGHQIREARASGAKKALVAGAAAAEEEAWSDDSDVPLDKVTHLPTRLFSYSSPPLTIQFYGKPAGVLAKSSTGGGAKSAEDEAAVAKRAADGVKIRAMALAVRDEEDGTDDRRPTKIVSQLACEGATVMYRVMYHDVGYHPATLYEDRSADWCRKWPGLVENYEKAPYIILPCYLTPPHHVSFECESTNLKTDPRPCGLSRAWRPI